MLGKTLYTSSCDAGARWTVTNTAGDPLRVWDSRNDVVTSKYDVLLRLTAHRQLAAAFSGQLDWMLNVPLDAETFVQGTQYDALNRPTSMTTPDQSVLKPEHNEAA